MAGPPKKRRLLGIEGDDEDAPPGAALAGDRSSRLDEDGDRRRIVVGAVVDLAPRPRAQVIVVGADEDRPVGERPAPLDRGDEVRAAVLRDRLLRDDEPGLLEGAPHELPRGTPAGSAGPAPGAGRRAEVADEGFDADAATRSRARERRVVRDDSGAKTEIRSAPAPRNVQ